MTREAELFKVRARSYGFLPTDLFKTIKITPQLAGNGTEYMIVGLNARKQTMPIILQQVIDGKPQGAKRVMSENTLRTLLNQQHPDPQRRSAAEMIPR